MFVRETLDNRLRHEVLAGLPKGQQHDMRLQKKNRSPAIGSIKNDKINYDRDEQFFSKDDIPQKARVVKQEVKAIIDPDHLGFRKRQWNGSVSVPKKIQADQTHEQRLLKIKLGFMDHPVPKFKQAKIYEGTDTRNDFTKWNVSNEILRKQIKENLMKTTMTAYENSKIKQKQLLKQYLDPLAKTTNFVQTFMKDWQEKQSLREQLRSKYKFQNPNASQQKTNAAVFRLVYQSTIKNKKDDIEAQAMKTDFRATLSQTQKTRLAVKASHSGVWQSFTEKEDGKVVETWAWSCCMSEDPSSKGCAIKLKDGNKWNLTSFNS